MPIKANINTISISKQSFLKLILFVLIGFLIIYIRSLILTLLVSFILASFAKYFAQSLESRYKIKYKYGLSAIFIFLAGSVIIGVLQLLPLFIREGYGLFETINIFVKNFESWLKLIGVPVDNIELSQFTNLIPNLGEATVSILGLLGQILTYALLIFVLAFYISINAIGVNKIVQIFVPDSIKDNIPNIIKKLEYHIGKWAFMEASLALLMSIFIYTIISILGFKYAFILALLAGISQLVPLIGPVLIISIIIIYAFVQSISLGIITIILMISVHLIKQFLFLPIVFNYHTPMNSLLIVFALMAGGVLAGPLGVIIAMPIVSLSKIIYNDIVFYDK
jgi:predicted PurR-regulated permease PerM